MNKIYCSNCSQLVNSTGNYCSFCGTALHGEESLYYHASGEKIIPHKGKHTIVAKKDVLAKSRLGFMAVIVFCFNYLLSTGILLLLLIGFSILQPEIGILVIGGFFMAIFLTAVLNYQFFWYEVNEEGLSIKYGILFQKHIFVPFSGIQNVNIERSLLDLILGIASVNVETAGSPLKNPIHSIGGFKAKSEAFIPALSIKKALLLHDLLVDGKIDQPEHKQTK